MNNNDKTKDQLLRELEAAHLRIRELEQKDFAPKQVKQYNSLLSQDILNNLPIGVALVDLQGIPIIINKKLSEMFGYTIEDIPNLDTWFQVMYPDETYRLEIIEKWRNALTLASKEKNEIEPVEAVVTCKNGETLSILFSGRVIGDQILILIQDISSRKKSELELRKQRALLNDVGDIAKIGGWEMDLISRTARWTKATYDIVEIEQGQAIPGPDEHVDYYLPEYRPIITKAMEDLIYKDIPLDFEAELRTAKGNIKWCRALGKAIREDDKCVRVYGTFQDITERKLAEISASRSENLFQKIFEILPIGVWIADKNGKLLQGNPAGIKIWGGSPLVPQEEYGVFRARRLPSREEIAPDDWALAHTVNEGVTIENELLEIDAFDKVTRTILNFTAPVLDEKGDIQAAVVVNYDLTELKNIERTLRETADKLQTILDNAGIGIVLINSRMEIQEMNYKVQQWFPNIRPGEKSICYKAFVDPSQKHICPNCPIELSLNDGQNHEATFDFKTSEGNRKIRVLTSVIRDAENKIVSVIELMEDITEQVKLEEQLLQAQKMESVGRLAGGIAHDFNNLLTAIQGFSELIYNSMNKHDPLRKDVTEIQKAADFASSLTQQLLAFSRKQIVAPRILNLNDQIQKTENMLGRLIGEDIELSFVLAEDLNNTKIDPAQLDQVLINLVVNARDAMPGIGRLTIETLNVTMEDRDCQSCLERMDGDYVMMAVSDNGKGIDYVTLKKIFDPFFTTKTVGKGTGLGLATVHGIVHQNNGHINVYSEIGLGTTFKIYFPVTEAVPKGDSATESITQIAGDETILLVEDQPMVRKLASRALKAQGYLVIEATNGEHALEVVNQYNDKIDLLLTDVVMPKMGGKQLYDSLHKKLPEMKVLYMSGYTENAIAHHGVLDEGTNFIPKPFRPTDLIKKLREVLNNR